MSDYSSYIFVSVLTYGENLVMVHSQNLNFAVNWGPPVHTILNACYIFYLNSSTLNIFFFFSNSLINECFALCSYCCYHCFFLILKIWGCRLLKLSARLNLLNILRNIYLCRCSVITATLAWRWTLSKDIIFVSQGNQTLGTCLFSFLLTLAQHKWASTSWWALSFVIFFLALTAFLCFFISVQTSTHFSASKKDLNVNCHFFSINKIKNRCRAQLINHFCLKIDECIVFLACDVGSSLFNYLPHDVSPTICHRFFSIHYFYLVHQHDPPSQWYIGCI